MDIEKTDLVFVPFPLIGHLAATLEIAKMMTRRDSRLSVTIFMIKIPFCSTPAITSDSDSIRFVTLPPVEFIPRSTGRAQITELLEAQIPLLRDAVGEIITRSGSARLGGFVLDMFCTPLIDLADEFGVPSYLFLTSGAAFLGFLCHLQFLHDYQGLDFDEFKNSDAELEVPSYGNPVPAKVFPSALFDKVGGSAEMFLTIARSFRRVKGIMVNTFVELESHAIRSFSNTTLAPVYPVGPINNVQLESGGDASTIMRWLDDQPSSSVVFLCFGSRGSFREDQVKEIAHGLERSGHRFLWSLRQPSPSLLGFPSDYTNIEEVLPEGFLGRTAEVGKVIGWAPQMAILAHPAVGGFVSHCGWNSTLESLWYGVPIATWPLQAEQQLNAFQLVNEGLATEIKMDYYTDSGYLVSAEEIQIGLNKLMDMTSEVRKKMKEMKNISRKVMIEEGSSYASLQRFIEDMMVNIP